MPACLRIPLGLLACALALAAPPGAAAADDATAPQSDDASRPAPRSIWTSGGIGHGFRTSVHDFGIDLEGGSGPRVYTQKSEHDLVLGSIRYGSLLTGNLEIYGELWGGLQVSPQVDYATGLSPHLRYFFMTRSRWTPFLDGAIGLADTSIRQRDLSTDFEFNFQVGGGVQYFLRDAVAFTFSYRWFHLSNAGIQLPNHGINVQLLSAGISWFL
jgi:opacity protein-like surface antigen